MDNNRRKWRIQRGMYKAYTPFPPPFCPFFLKWLIILDYVNFAISCVLYFFIFMWQFFTYKDIFGWNLLIVKVMWFAMVELTSASKNVTQLFWNSNYSNTLLSLRMTIMTPSKRHRIEQERIDFYFTIPPNRK